MFNSKATSYQQMEEKPKEKKFKQNEYEKMRKLVEDNEGNEVVKEIKTKKKSNNQENKYIFELFD